MKCTITTVSKLGEYVKPINAVDEQRQQANDPCCDEWCIQLADYPTAGE